MRAIFLYAYVNLCCICEENCHIPVTGSNTTGTETHSLHQGWTQTMTAPKTEAKEAGILNADFTKGAREYVARTAASVKERNDSAYEGVTKLNSGIEKTMTRFVGGYVGLMGEMAKAAHEDVAKALTTVEKVAHAKSFTEAAQAQVDFYRDYATTNYDRAQTVVAAGRDMLNEGVETIREGASDVWPFGKKAA